MWGTQAYLVTKEGARRAVAILKQPTMSAVRAAMQARGLRPSLAADVAIFEICGRVLMYPPAVVEGVMPSHIEPGRENSHAQCNIQAEERGELDLDAYVGYEPIKRKYL